eukprot:15366945-Ditylum_brightwellii.AAC.2
MSTQCFLHLHKWGTQWMGRLKQQHRTIWKCGGGRECCITVHGAKRIVLPAVVCNRGGCAIGACQADIVLVDWSNLDGVSRAAQH